MSKLSELSKKERQKINIPLCYSFKVLGGEYAYGMVNPKDVLEPSHYNNKSTTGLPVHPYNLPPNM